MIPFKHDLGTILKDIVTGFEGVVMGRTQYFTNCNHYGLCSQKINEKGKPDEWIWFDEKRLISTKKKKIAFAEDKPSSGIFQNPPEM